MATHGRRIGPFEIGAVSRVPGTNILLSVLSVRLLWATRPLRLSLLCVNVPSYGTETFLAESARPSLAGAIAGVRRVGKTYLCQSLPAIEYFDCEVPRIRRMMLDPQSFLDSLRGRRIVL